jgi:hypothetical protein
MRSCRAPLLIAVLFKLSINPIHPMAFSFSFAGSPVLKGARAKDLIPAAVPPSSFPCEQLMRFWK